MDKTIEQQIAKYMQRLIAQQKRDDEIRRLREDGKTLAEIGKLYGLTRARIWQIVGKKRHEKPNGKRSS